MGHHLQTVYDLIVGVALVWASGALGWWWVALVFSLLVGFDMKSAPRAWVVGVGAGVLGWGLPLAWLAFTQPVGLASKDLSALMGYGFAGTAVVVTVVVGGALGACGTWVGRALRSYRKAEHH